jgi:hypothetical protein
MIVHEFCEEDPLENNHRDRSNFVRELVQRPNEPARVPRGHLAPPPRRIVQCWDDLGRLPVNGKARKLSKVMGHIPRMQIVTRMRSEIIVPCSHCY